MFDKEKLEDMIDNEKIQIVMIGNKYGEWIVSSKGKTKKYPHGFHHYYLCKCSCGKIKEVAALNLLSGKSKSCGCLNKELMRFKFRTHGLTGTRTYLTWKGIVARCRRDPNYAGRGIKVCKRWNKFENFFRDMGEAPEGMSIDRIDNNGDYELFNCRWATPLQQANNKRNNVFLTYENKTMTCAQWSKYLGIGDYMIEYRIKKRMPTEEMMNQIIEWKGKRCQ